LRNTAASYETDRQVEGTVEADEIYHTTGQKGQAKQGGKKPWVADHVGIASSASPSGSISVTDCNRNGVGLQAAHFPDYIRRMAHWGDVEGVRDSSPAVTGTTSGTLVLGESTIRAPTLAALV
jgi:hypothetical protein